MLDRDVRHTHKLVDWIGFAVVIHGPLAVTEQPLTNSRIDDRVAVT